MVDKNGKISQVNMWVEYQPYLNGVDTIGKITKIRNNTSGLNPVAEMLYNGGLYGRNSCEIEKATRDEVMMYLLEK